MPAIRAERPPEDPRQILTPSALNRLVRGLIEDVLPMVWIEGEVSNFVRAASGHWYFSLKDAEAEVRCAMFARSNARVSFRPGNGTRVLARARPGLYEPRGSFQLVVEHLEDAGEGALRRAFELLKARLAAEGLFDESRKRALPAFPRRIGVVTSPAGAAIRDVLSVARRRFALTEIEVLPVLVQGSGAAGQVTAMLEAAARARRHDVLLVTRGGGSLEDLAAFNDEAVARAIAASPVPVVSAVGHEIDFSIADFVADLRAPTPSAAAELILPDGAALARNLGQLAARGEKAWRSRMQVRMQRLDQLALRMNSQRPRQRLDAGAERMHALQERLLRSRAHAQQLALARVAQAGERLRMQQPGTRLVHSAQHNAELARRLDAAWRHLLAHRRQRLAELARALHAVSPLDVLKRGYAILLDADGSVVRSARSVAPGSRMRARLADGELGLRALAPDADE